MHKDKFRVGYVKPDTANDKRSDIFDTPVGGRGSWVWRDGKFIPKHEARSMDAPTKGAADNIPRPYIMGDIPDYIAQDGTPISGRAQHRQYLKDNNLIELGNEKPKPAGPKKIDKADLQADIKESLEQLKAGYVCPETPPDELSCDSVDVPDDIQSGDIVRSEIKPE